MVTKTFACTNHTVLAEALRPGRSPSSTASSRPHRELFARSTAASAWRWPARPGAGAPSYGPISAGQGAHGLDNLLRLYSINGVAALHTEMSRTWANGAIWPERFNNKTNSVTCAAGCASATRACRRSWTRVTGSDTWVRTSVLAEHTDSVDESVYDLVEIKHAQQRWTSPGSPSARIEIDPGGHLRRPDQASPQYSASCSAYHIPGFYQHFHAKQEPSQQVPKRVFIFGIRPLRVHPGQGHIPSSSTPSPTWSLTTPYWSPQTVKVVFVHNERARARARASAPRFWRSDRAICQPWAISARADLDAQPDKEALPQGPPTYEVHDETAPDPGHPRRRQRGRSWAVGNDNAHASSARRTSCRPA